MSGIPDYTLGDTLDFKFTTRQISGAPSTLGGSPVVSAYPDNSTTQITSGITLTVDFDSVTGLNNVRVVATSGNGFASGSTYFLVITTGTVNSVSVVGEVIGAFSLGRSAAAVDLANGTDGLGAIKSDTAAILVDTGTTLDGKIDTIDTNVDSILADTGTDGVVVAAGSKTGYTLTPTTGLGNQTADINGTVTTVTNLTNAPTNGDLTATMKTSVTTAATAATPTAAAVTDVSNIVTGPITVSGGIASADIKKVNNVTVNGDGSGTPWGP